MQKKNIRCLKYLKHGSFYDDYLVFIEKETYTERIFTLRAINKKNIVRNVQDENTVIYDIRIRSRLKHPYLINNIDAFQDYDTLYCIMDSITGPLIGNKMLPNVFPLDVVRFYCAEIFLCLDYLHKKGQIYTHLSPENIHLDRKGHVKLDYSFCNNIYEDPEEFSRNLEYRSVNYLLDPNFSKYTDYWSFGIVLYRLAIGYTPFSSETPESTVQLMFYKDLYFTEGFNKDLQSLIETLLADKSKYNENIRDFVYTHKFFESINWKKLKNKEIAPPYIPVISMDKIENCPTLDLIYTSEYLSKMKQDGYGKTFQKYWKFYDD